ncbi:hypothetical protein OIU34_18080 [Pararhizobium sp. BT-229]|uniref:hypothetical protein n=1 Tax=Pararhizobium sp. BT-229 TaxID=2986923 RepID=UPI0021F7EB37|nr:hypothetical protein [Pararhizobium sp. BT-229]MCV9963788.1 hypothetical protein [Pararhizobium sp. BT-229]
MMFEKDAGVSGKDGPGGPDLAEIYSIRCIRDMMRIRAPDKTTMSVPSDCDAALVALSVFAPTGVATIDARSNLSLMEIATGRTVEFPARHVTDIAGLVSAFAVVRETPRAAKEEVTPPLPEAVFDAPAQDPATVPAWITENPDLKRTLVEDDGRLVLSFAPLRVSSKSKYIVEGRSDGGVPDYWGYEVTADGQPFGWVALMDQGTVLVTGVAATRYSKHRNIRSAMFRLSSHLESMRSE